MFLPTSIFVYHVHAVLAEARRRCWFPWNWNYRSVVSCGCWALCRFLCPEVSLQSQPFSSYCAISYSVCFFKNTYHGIEVMVIALSHIPFPCSFFDSSSFFDIFQDKFNSL